MTPADRYREIPLGREALVYLRACLARGKTLARFLLARRDLSEGRIVTLLPPEADLACLHDFENGILPLPPSEAHVRLPQPDGSSATLVPVPNTDPALADLVRGFLAAGAGRVCLFEEALGRPSDPWLASVTVPFWVHGEELYWVVTDPDPAAIEDAITRAASFAPPTIAALSQRPDAAPSHGSAMTEHALAALARRAEQILVGAYDGEGYLVWTRPA